MMKPLAMPRAVHVAIALPRCQSLAGPQATAAGLAGDPAHRPGRRLGGQAVGELRRRLK